MELRPYQKEAIRSLWQWIRDNPTGNPLLVMPTGSGKSLVISKICQLITQQKPHLNILVLAHRKELLEQNTDELLGIYEEAPVGIYCAGLGKKEISKITIASIQSIYNKTNELPKIDIMIVDECHLVAEYEESMYQQLINSLKDYNPLLRIIGLTATPFRVDGGYIYGADKTFSGIAYNVDLEGLVNDNYLSPLRNKILAKETLDLSNVKKVGGDYNKKELSELFAENDELMDLVAQKIVAIKEKEKTKKLLIFCSGVEHSVKMAVKLMEYGLNGEVLTAESERRDEIIQEFKNGKYDFLTNCNILTTGFNCKDIDMIVLLRPTLSTSLYVQMLGRGMRIAEGKEDCLVLDFAGNIEQHGNLVNLRVYSTGEKKPTKEKLCPNCEEVVKYALKVCPYCDYEFPYEAREFKPNHNKHFYSEKDVLGNSQGEWFDIQSFWLSEHHKVGKPVSIKVNIKTKCGLWISEWVCIEHSGFAEEKAVKWILNFFDDAINWDKEDDWTVKAIIAKHSQMKKPKRVLAKMDGSFWRVKKYEF